MTLQWRSHFNLLSIVVPRYLYSSTTYTLLSWMTVSDWDGGYFLKSMHMSLVFVAFRHKYDLSHHATKSFNTGPWPTSSLDNRLSKAVSSENLIKYLFGRMLLQSFVYKMNKRGDKTHHWGEPVETTFTLKLCYSLEPVGVSPPKNQAPIAPIQIQA